MPSLMSRLCRLLVKYWVAPNFNKKGATIQQQREFLVRMCSLARLPKNIKIQPAVAGGVPCEWVSAPGARDDQIIMYLHGGGCCMGSCECYRDLPTRISQASGARALVVDYRLAPEHPFPAQMEDTLAAYGWLIENGISPGSIVMGGDSAGGGLTLTTLIALRDRGDRLPAAAFYISPLTDWVLFNGESYRTRQEADPWLFLETVRAHAKYYVGDNDKDTPLLSPLNADLRSLPPTYIQVGDDEVLLSDSTRLAQRAREAGVDVTLDVWKGMWHVFQGYASLMPEAQRALELMGEFIRKHINR